MKKVILLILGVVAMVMTAKADDPTGDALRFRSSMRTFLQEEGYSPYIDSDDGTLCFKKEGTLYWIEFKGASKPVYIEFHRAGNGTTDCDMNILRGILNKVNRTYRCVKCILSSDESFVSYAVEVYANSLEDFKYCFYKYMSVLDSGHTEVVDGYTEAENSGEYASSTPVKFNSASVRNEDNDGNVITDWGTTIYAYRTKYLTPKINVTVSKEGNYDIYVKMYGPNGLTTGDNSPSGYSYKATRYLNTGTRDVKLTGWGSNTAGHWSAGDYRFEFYLNGRLLGTKYFTIK